MDLMFERCGAATGTPQDTILTDSSGLAIHDGIYKTAFHQQKNIQAVIIGSPTWSDNTLADKANAHGLAASLIQAYQHLGSDLLTKLHGPFALAVIDGDKALIAIDRIGIHCLSYAVQDGVFVFSTSSNGVVSHQSINGGIDPQGIFNYFYFYDIPSPGTIHNSVEKLLPAQYVRFCEGRVEKGFYWRLEYNDYNHVSFQKEKTRLEELLHTSIESVSRDGATATFLSGGIDSSTITGVLANMSPDTVNAYTIGFGAEGFDEMEYARLAARHFGANINEYYIQPEDILEAIPLIAKSYDEPFANESAVPAYFCAKKAANDGIKIMLGGDGGDEIFGGNERYAKQMVFEHYTKLPGLLRKGLVEPLAFGFPGGDSIMPLRKLKSYIRQANTPLPKRLEAYNFILRQPLKTIFTKELLSSVDPEIPEALLDDAYFRADSTHPVNRMLHMDMKFTLADNDLRKVSRMCEAAGVEVRYPLLNERLVEFSGQLPASYKVRRQRLRWFFKRAMKDFLPREIIHKSKHGFGLPFGVWALSHPDLRDFVNETLDRFQDRNYLQPDYIQNIRSLHAGEHPTYYGKMIWLMLILEQWLEAHAHAHVSRGA
jgi:asparagine synthase (glutamine-hydrolysing)